MLLDSDSRHYPQVWRRSFVAEPLRWVLVEFLGLHRLPARSARQPLAFLLLMTVVRVTARKWPVRLEGWTVLGPELREERVLAYRAHPEGHCPCCQRPAVWKLPQGPRG